MIAIPKTKIMKCPNVAKLLLISPCLAKLIMKARGLNNMNGLILAGKVVNGYMIGEAYIKAERITSQIVDKSRKRTKKGAVRKEKATARI